MHKAKRRPKRYGPVKNRGYYTPPWVQEKNARKAAKKAERERRQAKVGAAVHSQSY